MAPAYSGYHPQANVWYQNYPQPVEDYRFSEAQGHDVDYQSRDRSRSRGRSQLSPDPESRRSGPPSGRPHSEASGRSSSRTKRSLAKSVYVDDMLTPKEPGTRPLSLRELADFDYNEKGRLVVKEHSTYGQPASSFLPRPSKTRSRSPSPAPGARADDAPPREDNEAASSAAQPVAPATDPSFEELKMEVARLRAELQAQQSENQRRQSQDSRALQVELGRLQSRDDALGHREARANQQVALKEEELDLVRLRLERIAQQMAEIRMNQCSRPRSERRAMQTGRSSSQGAVPNRRAAPGSRMIAPGPEPYIAEWLPGGGGRQPVAPAPPLPVVPEGTLLYRTVDENGNEVEYREIAVVRHNPGERRVVSERYADTPVKGGSGKYPAGATKPKSGDSKPFPEVKKEPLRASGGSYDLPPPMLLIPVTKETEKSVKGFERSDPEYDDWEMPTTPTKPPSAPVDAHVYSPSKAGARTGPSKSRASEGPPRRSGSRGAGTRGTKKKTHS